MSTSLSDYMNDGETYDCPNRDWKAHFPTTCMWCVLEKLIDDIPALIEAALDDFLDDLTVSIDR